MAWAEAVAQLWAEAARPGLLSRRQALLSLAAAAPAVAADRPGHAEDDFAQGTAALPSGAEVGRCLLAAGDLPVLDPLLLTDSPDLKTNLA